MKTTIKYLGLLISLLSGTARALPADTLPSPLEDSPVLSIAAADWNGDKLTDSAVLIKSEDQADLYVYLGNADGEMVLNLYKKHLVWSGALAGTTAYLKTDPKTGLLSIYAENDAIGRDRWHQQLTLEYKNNAFLVSGLIYDSVDTLKPDAGIRCEVDFAQGKLYKNKKSLKAKPHLILLKDWSDKLIPAVCKE